MTDEIERCGCSGCGCGCSEPATTTDDGGVPVCDACAHYTCTADGTVVCSRIGLGRSCHECQQEIAWGALQTHPVSGNYRIGRCGCDDAHWIVDQQEHYEYVGRGHYDYEEERR